MRRPRVIQPHPDLFASEEPSAMLKILEEVTLLALVGLLLMETVAEVDAAEDDHEDHL